MISGIGQLNWTSGTAAMSARPTPAEMFAKMDTNGDGSVDKAEFTAFGQQMAAKIGKPDKSEELFAKIDTDGDGKISQSENDAFVSQMQSAMPPPPDGAGKNPDDMFAKMDTNGDGSVDKTEFSAFFQQRANQADSQADSTNKPDDLFSQIDTDIRLIRRPILRTSPMTSSRKSIPTATGKSARASLQHSPPRLKAKCSQCWLTASRRC